MLSYRESQSASRQKPENTSKGISSHPRLNVGNIVLATTSRRLGHIVSIEDGEATIKVFLAPDQFEESTYPINQLVRFEIPSKSQVYTRSGDTGHWTVGRILSCVPEDPVSNYEIKQPGRPTADLPESEVEILSFSAKIHPADALASGAVELQKASESRNEVIRALYYYRAKARGLTGLLSASIQLLPHQIEIVQRIMSDPVQRYLLADEVGLGKTIEAGCVIKQALLDNPDERVAIVAPSQLIPQWVKELDEKFHLSESEHDIRFVASENISVLKDLKISTLVIDEIHNMIESATPEIEHIDDNPMLKSLVNLCSKANRLMLLSATPVIADDPVTLVMLHLLDPLSNRLDKPGEFSKKSSRAQQIGRLLIRLRTGSNAGLLKRVLSQLTDLLPDDEFIQDSAKSIQDVPNDSLDATDIDQQTRLLRRYVSESYRIHQRLLRTRRTELPEWVLLPQKPIVMVEEVGDTLVNQIIDRMMNFSEQISLAHSSSVEDGSADKVSRRAPEKVELHREMFDSISGGTAAIRNLISRQLGTEPVLGAIDSDIQTFSDTDTRTSQTAAKVAGYLSQLRRDGVACPRLVAFTSSAEVAKQIAGQLAPFVGQSAVKLIVSGLNEKEIESQVSSFQTHVEPSVLVCDRSGEEGLNLHFADGIIHLDLPFSAVRMQQRIGRLDRFGRKLTSIHHYVMLPTLFDGSPWIAWFRLLKDGFGLFDQSISDVQFMLRELQAELDEILLFEGATGLERMLEVVITRIQTERQRLEEQSALDTMFMNTENETAVPSLQMARTDELDDDNLSTHIERWGTREIGLTKRLTGNFQSPKIFELHLDGRAKIPRDVAYSYFSEGLETPLTCDRQTANSHPGVHLLRPGSAFVDGITEFLRDNNLGSTFSTWRMFAGMNADSIPDTPVLRIAYTVECNIEIIRKALGDNVDPALVRAVMRRADSLFSPFTGIFHVGTDLNPESIPDQIKHVIDGSFDGQAENDLWLDRNLIDQEEIQDAAISPELLSELCSKIKNDLHAVLSSAPEFKLKLETARARADQSLDVENAILTLKSGLQTQVSNEGESDFEKEIRVNKIIAEAVASPRIEVDAIGLLIISGRPPSLPRVLN